MKKIYINKELLIYIFIFAMFIITLAFMVKTSSIPQMLHKDVVNMPVNDKISHDEVKLYLRQINIKFPEIVYAQTVLETGNFTSNICYENNNICGMKVSFKRPTTAIGSKNGYAQYKSWRESLLDYALYQSYYFSNVKTVEEYLDSLDNYAEDTLYIAKIKQIAKQF